VGEAYFVLEYHLNIRHQARGPGLFARGDQQRFAAESLAKKRKSLRVAGRTPSRLS